MKKFDIYNVDFWEYKESRLNTDPNKVKVGKENRPGLLLEDENIIIPLAKITGTKPPHKNYFYLDESSYKSFGLDKPSYIDFEEIVSYRPRDLVKYRGTLTKDIINKLKEKHLVESFEEETQHKKYSLSKDEMKQIICGMIDKYDASEEEVFDELQSHDDTITRDVVSRLYKMCSKNTKLNDEIEEDFSLDEIFNELDELGED